jgi:hypothetical protein
MTLSRVEITPIQRAQMSAGKKMTWMAFLICAFLGIGFVARRWSDGAKHLIILALIAVTLTAVFAGFQAVP